MTKTGYQIIILYERLDKPRDDPKSRNDHSNLTFAITLCLI